MPGRGGDRREQVQVDGVGPKQVAQRARRGATIGAAIAASIVLHIAVAIASPKDAGKKDERDREIYRFGEYTGQSFVVVGGVAVLIMAKAEVDYFWIADAIYLVFVLSGILGSAAKLVAYRQGFQPS